MSTSGESFPVGAYFYPQTVECEIRAGRAAAIGRRIMDETLLAQQATPLFEGHQQPQVYCLGEAGRTRWDDADDDAMGRQVELMQDAGLDFVVFDTYGGSSQGSPGIRELEAPTEAFLRIPSQKRPQFGVMWCLSRPRVDLPAPLHQDNRDEPNRTFDQSRLSAEFLVDECARKYWTDPGYLHVKNRPYLSIYTAYSGLYGTDYEELEMFTAAIRERARTKYKIDPYLVAVDRYPRASFAANQLGLDAVTGYALLPDFSFGHTPLQKYNDRVDAVGKVWDNWAQSNGVPFVPPIVKGWDSSPRGEPGGKLEEVSDRYPFTPIIYDGTPDKFAVMARKALEWTAGNTPELDRYGIVCSWNEMGEGVAILPTVVNGQVDDSYLRALSRAITDFRTSPVNRPLPFLS